MQKAVLVWCAGENRASEKDQRYKSTFKGINVWRTD